ncbi:MAG TPA: UDP-N-acetylmuramoyl-L-alanyl-D-glutamate--2,6-diaminopimelate ligase, partial [Myxococcaceae bacterium]|nr:UDP-N-acetylmuramoyl-L-alanyl-D-glutamate--2,6-diaminopimelate ligase [Myxococcaceae bacterium]
LAGAGAEQLPAVAAKVEISGVAHDSRRVRKGDLFVALPGTKVDGAQFAGEAAERGAVAIAAEKAVEAKLPSVVVGSARKALAVIAANFYARPADQLKLLAVTGTNGKTTTSYLLESICSAGGAACGLFGPIEYRFAGKVIPATHTTPDALELHRILRQMVEHGVDTVSMEVSSHALDQERVHGLTFGAAAFTNLTRDHLDYHRDLEEYFQSKRKLFVENLSPGGVAVVNGDDTYGSRIYSELRGSKRMAWKFSRAGNAEISASKAEFNLAGIQATLKTPAGDIPVRSRLLGFHNLENILAAAGVALSAGFSRRDVQDGIERLQGVPGRMERVEERGVVALVDYAHSDDALKRALEAIRSLSKGRLLVVFGCGGDRDRGKRPLMGSAAAEGADLAVVTSDNPRSEDPDEIIGQITGGIERAGFRRISVGKARAGEKGYLVESDRKQAIALAASLAKPGDVILIAGKGHEPYQEIQGEQHPFDDRREAAEALKARA